MPARGRFAAADIRSPAMRKNCSTRRRSPYGRHRQLRLPTGTEGSNPASSSAESSHVTDMYGDAQSDRTEPGAFRHLGSMHRFLELAPVPLFKRVLSKLPTLPDRYCWHRTD
jgi:hypothetical protein